MMTGLLILLGTGVIAGLLAGLLGVGGGLVIVPLLAIVLESQGISPDVIMHVAIGTSLATIIITSLSSIRAHHKRGAVQWPVFRQITPGILFGSWLGAMIAGWLDGTVLKVFFGLFMLAVATQMLTGAAPKPHRQLPGPVGMFSAGSVIGTISAIVGIGGGTMSVPFMSWCNVPLRQAVATSSAIGLPIAIAGATGFVMTGWAVDGRPDFSLGYVSLPAFASIVVASILFAPVGASLAHRLPPMVLRRFFAVFLVVLGVRMLLTVFAG